MRGIHTCKVRFNWNSLGSGCPRLFHSDGRCASLLSLQDVLCSVWFEPVDCDFVEVKKRACFSFHHIGTSMRAVDLLGALQTATAVVHESRRMVSFSTDGLFLTPGTEHYYCSNTSSSSNGERFLFLLVFFGLVRPSARTTCIM